jgi:hypothetical protein
MVHAIPFDDDVEGEGFIDVVDLLDVEELNLWLANFAVEEGGVVAFCVMRGVPNLSWFL